MQFDTEQREYEKHREAQQNASRMQQLQEQKEKNKNTLENLLNENNAKERDLEIIRKRVMVETNELNNLNGKIMKLTQ